MVRKSIPPARPISQASPRDEGPTEPVRESGATHSPPNSFVTRSRPRGSAKKKPPKDYTVGYGKPPKAYRFKPGQSGNRLGRPRPLPKLSDLIRKELKRKRNIVDGGLRVSVPTIELLIKRLIEMAAKGAFPALMHVFEVADQISAKERYLATYQSGSERITKDMSAIEAAKIYEMMLRDDPP